MAEEIRVYAPLHDIGKIGIPDSILLKPAKLISEEWNIMKQHPLIGGRLIKAIKGTQVQRDPEGPRFWCAFFYFQQYSKIVASFQGKNEVKSIFFY
jgi:hypothetical protein